MRISLVIPTRHRPGPLSACLSALAPSFPSDAETILVFDGCEAPEDVLAPFRHALRLRHLEVPHGGPAAARNRGLAAARGDIVVFTDDDCRPQPGWLEALAGAVRLTPPVAAGGTTRNGLSANPYADASQCILAMVGRHGSSAAAAERLFPSNNFAFPARALRDLGGFDERFTTAEDRDLCRRWRAAGFELRPVPEALLDHDSRLDLRGFMRQFVAYGRGAARFHASAPSTSRSFAGSLGFHVRLPVLAAPEVRRRGLVGGARLVALLLLWEAANLIGFCATLARGAAAAPLARSTEVETGP